MTDLELILDWIEKLQSDLRAEVGDLSPAALAWQPDDEANNMGVTVWHVARWLDLLAARVLADRPADAEQWFTRGWAQRTGYDPRGIGLRGYGALTGYTQAEVKAVPALTADELLDYLAQSCEALCAELRALPPDALHKPTRGMGGRGTPYAWLKSLLPGCFGHVGEIQALKAMYARAHDAERVEA